MSEENERQAEDPALAFSCVIDRPDGIQLAAYRWALSLIRLEGVAPDRIFVQSVERGLAIIAPLRALGVQVLDIARFGDGKHCNKLRQLEAAAHFGDGAVVLFDCDTVATGQFVPEFGRRFRAAAAVHGTQFHMGKPVDAPNPPVAMFRQLLGLLGLPPDLPLTAAALDRGLLPRGYFNGGLYGFPTAIAPAFGERWQYWATRLLESPEARKILDRYFWHVDQISHFLAARDLGLAEVPLDLRFNCPTHYAWPEAETMASRPIIVHYHNNVQPDGRIGLLGVRQIDSEALRANAALATDVGAVAQATGLTVQPFKSWDSLEEAMSVTTRNVNHLQALLRAAGIETVRSVLEYRCGTGRHLEWLKLANYSGYDDRPAEIATAALRTSAAGFAVGRPGNGATADLVICLDAAGLAEDQATLDNALGLLAASADGRLLMAGEAIVRWGAAGLLDVARAMRRSGAFERILVLGSHGGRDIYLGLKSSAVTEIFGSAADLRSALDGNPQAEAMIIAALAAQSRPGAAATGSGDLVEQAALLSVVDSSLEGQRVALLAPPEFSLEAALALRQGHLTLTGEAAALTAVSGWEVQDLCVAASIFDRMAAGDRKALLLQLAKKIRPGGRLLLSVRVAKRGGDFHPPDRPLADGAQTGLAALRRDVETAGFMIAEERFLPLPFDCPFDLAVMSAWCTGGRRVLRVSAGGGARKRRTPEILRNMERSLRRMIRGRKRDG